MADQRGANPAAVKRVVFKEIVEGDFRKFRAKSNDSDSGGGARDLRFRPHDEFSKIFRKIFPGVRTELRSRGKRPVEVEVFVGQLHWKDETGAVQAREVTYEPPTDARGGEGRIPIVYTYPPFNKLPPTQQGRIVALLIERADGTVWPAFASEESLRSGNWEPAVAGRILRCLGAQRRGNAVARGYIDFETDEEYSDA